ncbi:hypothetical Protein YC6258_04774 [Gynuella sunshinyii YC6258]|uniref:Uncharacterized protein n=1 Tax=Gynuella sunshinyii YC6258 TaxID=1445510 RepID=A0A0C5VRD8_9GAMM|nr:hypothetical Protein YC6258_04774 [Gynuella sunshinyii YC6258]
MSDALSLLADPFPDFPAGTLYIGYADLLSQKNVTICHIAHLKIYR